MKLFRKLRKIHSGALLQNLCRTRANEKFSGKGHKNHIYTGKSSKKDNKNSLSESAFAPHYKWASNYAPIQLEEECIEDDWVFTVLKNLHYGMDY